MVVYLGHVVEKTPPPLIPPSTATDDSGAVPLATYGGSGDEKTPSESFLGPTRRNLTEKEASSPAGVRWLQHDAERLYRECQKLKAQVDGATSELNAARSENARLLVEQERLKGSASRSTKTTMLADLVLAGGSAIAGLSASFFADETVSILAQFGFGVSVALIFGSLIVRYSKWD